MHSANGQKIICPAYFALLGKIYSPCILLAKLLILLAADFAQNSASKFCQGPLQVFAQLLYICSVRMRNLSS